MDSLRLYESCGLCDLWWFGFGAKTGGLSCLALGTSIPYRNLFV